MTHTCESQSICIDKPSVSKLTQSMYMSGLFKQTEEEKIYPERPLYRTEIGRITWNVLHRIASSYSANEPSEEEKELMRGTFKAIGTHFPCRECADHYKKEFEKIPIKLDNNRQLSQWVCIQHNNVNSRLGKKLFDCDKIDKIINDYKI